MPETDATRTAFKTGEHDHAACIDDALAAAEEVCGTRGLRLTPLRRRVLEMIWQSHNPVGAYDLLDQLRAERGTAAPPTVYRALEFLLETGLIHKIESLNAFVGCPDPHDAHSGQFLICRDCRAVGELDDDEIRSLLTARAGDLGFSVQSQMIEVMGLCPDCAGQPGAADGA